MPRFSYVLALLLLSAGSGGVTSRLGIAGLRIAQSLPIFAVSVALAQSPGQWMDNARAASDDPIQHQTTGPDGATTLYFPDFVEGDGWTVQLVLSNLDSARSVEAVVEVYGQDAHPVENLFASTTTLQIPALGTRVLESSGAGPIRRGWIQVRTGSAKVSGLLTYRDDTTGAEVSVEPVALGDRFALFVEESPTVGAGVALFKSAAAPEIKFRIRDEAGQDPIGAVLRWGEFRQRAWTLPEWLEGVDQAFLRDFRGLLLLGTEAEAVFAPLGLRFGKDPDKFSLSAVPVIPVQDAPPPNPFQIDPATEGLLYFPDYVQGGGWSVQSMLSNLDSTAIAEVEVRVHDQSGRPVRDLFGSNSSFEIPALGSRGLRSGHGTRIRRGWIQVRSEAGSVRGLLTYRHAESGIEVGVAPVELGNRFAFFVEETAEIGTGLAIFKPEASPEIEFEIRDEEGQDPMGKTLRWGDFRQRAHTLPEWLAEADQAFLADFRGLLFLRGADNSGFAPIGLRFGKRKASLSAVPVVAIRDKEARPQSLYWIDAGTGKFQRAYLDGSNVEDLITGLNAPIDLALDLSRDKLYWIDSEEEKIQRLNLDGSEVEDLVTGLNEPVGLALDLARRKLYWTDAGTGKIQRANLDGSDAEDLITGLNVPVRLALDLGAGKLYWTDLGTDDERLDGAEKIQRANLDGSNVEDLITGLRFPIGLALGGGKLYWTDWAPGTIQRANLDGSGAEGLVAGLDFPWSLALGGGKLYWTDLGSDPESVDGEEKIQQANLDGSGVEDLITGLRAPVGLALDLGVTPRNPIPPRVSLSASPASVVRGRSATLTWSSTNAVSATITPDIGAVPTSGSRRVSPTVTTTYRIAVQDIGGQTASAAGAVTVTDPPPPTVTISASPSSIDWGQSTTLTWSSANAVTATITPDFGAVSTSGSRKVSPNVTTTYRITVHGAGGQTQTATASTKVTVIISERAALTALYEATRGPNWTHRENWMSGRPFAEWYGVQVDGQGRIVRLSFHENGLIGSVPAELGALTHLRTLDLGNNELTGPIPVELASLTDLTNLRLGNNQLAGRIPPELGSLTHLRTLNLGANALTGSIPLELGKLTHLRTLSLGHNALTGPIPLELASLVHLTFLDLGSNELTDRIPPELGALTHLTLLSLGFNELTGPIPPELGALVQLTYLHVENNQLTGPLPSELGGLANLRVLLLERNSLTGPVPSSFLKLDLELFRFGFNQGLCVPGSTDFVIWSSGIANLRGDGFCNDSDRAVLEFLYDFAGGSDWTNSDGWRGDGALDEWYGVSVDSLGRVTALDLSDNELEGRLPGNLAQLSQLNELRVDGNALSGRLPMSLTHLPLQELHYVDTDLCAPVERSFQAWLRGIASHDGTGVECAPLSDRDVLVALYDTAGGPNWTDQENWLTDRPLGEWHGVSIDAPGRVVQLWLMGNGLAGLIPPELGALTELEALLLNSNTLTGPIPSELSALTRLQSLDLYGNGLTGPIPVELASLTHLRSLNLSANALTGPIPLELTSLTHLTSLFLQGNELAGPIPPELGGLDNLRDLVLSRNTGMSGALPDRLTNLSRLDLLLAGDTGLCAPSDASFTAWLEGVWKRRVRNCAPRGGPAAYLTQAVQSPEFPVPLVAGEDALLRVFVAASRAAGQGLPPVRAKFYRNGAETHVVELPGSSHPIPSEVREGELHASLNAEIPGRVVQPGLEIVIEIAPQGTGGSSPGLTKRFPESGRLPVDVRSMSVFDLTVVPFLWSQNPDSSIEDIAKSMAGDPEVHELLWETRTLLPIGELDVKVHESVLSSTNNSFSLLVETEAIRVMEDASGYYMGMMTGDTTGPTGVAVVSGNSIFSIPQGGTIAHELGHNLSLQHAPCGNTYDLDPSFPTSNGSIGAWGYDFREGGRLVSPARPDLMSYCGPKWISDYHFTNALRYRLHTVASGGLSALVAAPAKALLLWGGVEAGGAPFLEPAFLVQAPPSLPRSAGEYEIVGRNAAGDELFSLSFDLPEVADGDGESSFAFALPVQLEWADELASIRLSGPGGSVSLDQDTDRPVTILRNPQTGQIRGILRGAAAAPQEIDATVSALSSDTVLERLTSRGIPDPEDWTQ